MNLAILVMAAGASRRFGGCKLLSELDGKPLLHYALDNAHSLHLRWVFCVTGAWHQQIQTAMQQSKLPPTDLLYNPDWQQGLGHSIAHAVKQLPKECEGVLIVLGDQWAIPQSSLQDMLADFDGQHIICARVENRRTVPALFPKHCFAELEQLCGDQGARQLLRSECYKVKLLSVPEADLDVDTVEGLKGAENLLVRK